MVMTITSIFSCLIMTGFLPSFLFNPEDGGDTLLQNNGGLKLNYTVLQQRISYPSEIHHVAYVSRVLLTLCDKKALHTAKHRSHSVNGQ
jgi:hypothetical protein